ncbi:MAG: precorrin-8X methylmutase [Rhodospirillales bacterium]
MQFDYIRDPDAIYAESFRRIRAETALGGLEPSLEAVTVRLVHACGMPEIVADVVASPDAAGRARDALDGGAAILCDARMVAEGIIRRRLPADNAVICTLNDDGVAGHARSIGNTRSAAAVDFWRDRMAGAVAAIGNAPTALFRLLELIADGAPEPAAILGFPVGFVGAAESKDALIKHAGEIPFITLRGRLGGSAMAAAAVNAIAGDLP